MGEEGVDDWSIRGVWGRREYMSGQLKVCGGEGWMMVHYRCVGEEGVDDWSIRGVWGRRE